MCAVNTLNLIICTNSAVEKNPKVNLQDVAPNVGLRLDVPNLRRLTPSCSWLLQASLSYGIKRIWPLVHEPRRIQRVGEGSNSGVVELKAPQSILTLGPAKDWPAFSSFLVGPKFNFCHLTFAHTFKWYNVPKPRRILYIFEEKMTFNLKNLWKSLLWKGLLGKDSTYTVLEKQQKYLMPKIRCQVKDWCLGSLQTPK